MALNRQPLKNSNIIGGKMCGIGFRQGSDKGKSGESLAWMAASEFILDAAVRFKLGHAPPSELLTDSNSAAQAFGH
ncbi:hypothetical protein PCANC_12588 [Puccinia coronata f. sp. avenae]|uniref:Uncharacterized protein n=1 Tax=Puccinia coronata f. sp. avenae TaxID=200324 RepID=A0A2N5UNE7_9BASI|nr:hypothetical protein PCANC_12588 [Puccinia coronata f. sp. avenae]